MGVCECCCEVEKSRDRLDFAVLSQSGAALPASFVNKGWQHTLLASRFFLRALSASDTELIRACDELQVNVVVFGSRQPPSLHDCENMLLFLYAYHTAIWHDFTAVASALEASTWVRLCRETMGAGKVVIVAGDEEKGEVQSALDGGLGRAPVMIIHSLDTAAEADLKLKYSLLGAVEFVRTSAPPSLRTLLALLVPFAVRH